MAIITGADQWDVLTGTGEDDVITGGGGRDGLTGGAGADRFVYRGAGDSPTSAPDIILDFQTGVDKLVFDFGQRSGQYIISWGLAYTATASYLFVRTIDFEMRIDVVGALQSGDIVFTGTLPDGSNQQSPQLYVQARPEGQTLTAGPGSILVGGAGADTLKGGTGLDDLRGGGGDDFLDSGWRSITALNVFSYPIERLGERLDGGDGNDTIWGGSGDTLIGGAGDDKIELGWGVGRTANPFEVQSGFADGGDGADDIRIYGRGDADGGAGNDTIFLSSLYGSGGSIRGGSGDDSLYLDNTQAFASGGDGNDFIAARADGAVLTGGQGADSFRVSGYSLNNVGIASVHITDFQTGIDALEIPPLTAFDTIYTSLLLSLSIVRYNGGTFVFATRQPRPGDPVSEFFFVASERDINGVDLREILSQNVIRLAELGSVPLSKGIYMLGDSVADTLIGSGLNDVIDGRAGADVIRGGGGADSLYGGLGADRFVYIARTDSAVATPDTILDFEKGVDKLDLTGVRTGNADRYGWAEMGGATFLFVDLGGDGTNDMLIQMIGVTGFSNGDLLW